jgi:hypothetical protein|nr:MAG TPA: hypothetical protein [Caudoviricetes sp.]
MKVPIDNMSFDESEYRRGDKVWKAQTLYDFAKAKEYLVLDMPLWNIDLTTEAFECSQLHSFIASFFNVSVFVIVLSNILSYWMK